MRLLYDHQFFPILRYSGISRYFYEIISRISLAEDTDVSLYMGWHINKYAFDSLSARMRHFFGRQRPGIPKTTRLFNALTAAGLPIFARLAVPDIYHQTFYWYLLPRIRALRVLTVYDMIYYRFPEYDQGPRPVRPAMDLSIRHADRILAISEATKQDILEFTDVPEENVRVTHLANSLVAEPSLVSPVDSPYILFVGQRFLWKNFTALLTAYCMSTDVWSEYRLVCFGGTELGAEEYAILDRHKVPRDRLLRATGPDEMLASYYEHASLFVYPSQYEGFGLPLLEAMHYGCPALSSDRASMPEVAGDAAHYFDPYSLDSLIDGLRRCLGDSDLRARLSRSGIEREKGFNWDRCAAETAEVYREAGQRTGH